MYFSISRYVDAIPRTACPTVVCCLGVVILYKIECCTALIICYVCILINLNSYKVMREHIMNYIELFLAY